MIRIFLAVFFLVIGLSQNAVAAQLPPLPLAACLDNAPFGFPQYKKQSNVVEICRSAYYVLYDGNAKIPMFTSYFLSFDRAIGCFPRANSFMPDQSIGTFSSLPKDYAKSKFDAGHLVNAGDMRWEVQAEEDSMIMTNITPQMPTFNRGVWKRLEDQIRGWVTSSNHQLVIYAGPIYNIAKNPTLKNEGRVSIPTAFFKVVIDPYKNEAIAFIFENKASDQPLSTFITSLADVQKQSKMTFPLPVGIKFQSTMWLSTSSSGVKARSSACGVR